jgi:hypothetical protein
MMSHQRIEKIFFFFFDALVEVYKQLLEKI